MKIEVSINDLIDWRNDWLDANETGDGTDKVTPFDVYLYGAKSPKFRIGDRVRKTKGSQWKGRIVGNYSTKLTPEGYAVESDTEIGSVQIYPAHALEKV